MHLKHFNNFIKLFKNLKIIIIKVIIKYTCINFLFLLFNFCIFILISNTFIIILYEINVI